MPRVQFSLARLLAAMGFFALAVVGVQVSLALARLNGDLTPDILLLMACSATSFAVAGIGCLGGGALGGFFGFLLGLLLGPFALAAFIWLMKSL